ncbi:MAG: ankyrin repeat domain-containing protein [Synergistaceae bacterium]|nr:ankyrin repeat domain-containing protein [Synergistaceae bacterium]
MKKFLTALFLVFIIVTAGPVFASGAPEEEGFDLARSVVDILSTGTYYLKYSYRPESFNPVTVYNVKDGMVVAYSEKVPQTRSLYLGGDLYVISDASRTMEIYEEHSVPKMLGRAPYKFTGRGEEEVWDKILPYEEASADDGTTLRFFFDGSKLTAIKIATTDGKGALFFIPHELLRPGFGAQVADRLFEVPKSYTVRKSFEQMKREAREGIMPDNPADRILIETWLADEARRKNFEFIQLCREGTTQQIEAAIEAGADVNARMNDGLTPLISAVKDNNDPEVLNLLIQKGADVSMKNNDGLTPLMLAAQSNNLEFLRALIQGGADVNAKNNGGWPALFIAVEYNNNPEIIAALIEAGADVNANANDYTPLLFAAAVDSSSEVVSLLIEKGADVNARMNDGFTALMLAAEISNDPEVLNILIRGKADVNDVNADGFTALMLAAYHNINPGMSKALIQGGADVNAKTDDGVTPLMLAVSNNPRAVPVLIKEGADINARYISGETALSFAIEKAKGPEAVSFLLKSGATVSENDVQLALENERLKDTAFIEELKQHLKK